jgi:DNA-directed RNA polymerase subunit RPC12/RpoP
MVDGLEQTGSHVSADELPTNYTYFRCRDCGQKWMLSEDTSVRGPARYLTRRRP